VRYYDDALPIAPDTFGDVLEITPPQQADVADNDARELACIVAASRELPPRSTRDAEQIAIRARDAGMDVVHNGIRFSPDEIVAAAKAKRPHLIGLSILSGSHVPLAREVVAKLKEAGLSNVKVVAGGIIPPEDEAQLKASGIAAVFSPKDYDLNAIMHGLIELACK